MNSQELFLKWRRSLMPKLYIFKRVRNSIKNIYKLNIQLKKGDKIKK